MAPVSWLVPRAVDKGRRNFNVTKWGVTEDQEADEAAELVERGEMPLSVYWPLHPEAQLSPAEHEALIAGLEATFGR